MDAFERTTSVSSATKPPLRVLVIDDDDSVCTAIRAILSRRNGETEIATRAAAGIRALETSRFDVAIIDVFMPGLSGLHTITHIRRKSTVPIIVMSGFRLRQAPGAEDYFAMAMQRGASTWLRKPFSPPQLLEAIDRSLAAAHVTGTLTQ
jgi:DNA-binding response OmpR family regulator